MNNQYPIGQYEVPTNITDSDVSRWISEIGDFPERLKAVLNDISDDQLSNQYREGSWDVRTLIHHVADSHLHGYQRTKLILTEDNPSVSTFEENEWVLLTDYTNNIDDSIQLITGIHNRWSSILSSLNDIFVCMAWHGKHHLEHIKIALRQK